MRPSVGRRTPGEAAMVSELQRIVDALGSELERSVAIDDPRFRLQAYSPHYGAVDNTRIESILRRQASAEAAAWLSAQGITQAEGPVRLPGNEELALLPRVAAPIRREGVHLGYLFIIDADESLGEAELEHVAAAASAAAEVMYREALLGELERSRERELLRDLLAEEHSVREDAARRLVEAELFTPGAGVAAVVVRVVGGQAGDERTRTALDIALGQGRRLVSARHGLQLARADHGVFLLATGDPALKVLGVEGFAESLRTRLAKLLPPGGGDVIAGIGEECAQLADAVVGYRQARQAALIGEVVPSFGPVIAWGQLGIYRLLAQIDVATLSADVLHPGLRTLFAADNAEPLVTTLECYLDRAGDAKAASAELLIHRTSLYYRLGRIQEIAGVDLHSGEDRLMLHLGLKLARLVGLHPHSGLPAGR